MYLLYTRLLVSVKNYKIVNGGAFASGKFFPAPRGLKKVKSKSFGCDCKNHVYVVLKCCINHLVVIVKIMFMWYKNVVATNITDINIPVVTLCDADFSVFFLEN